MHLLVSLVFLFLGGESLFLDWLWGFGIGLGWVWVVGFGFWVGFGFGFVLYCIILYLPYLTYLTWVSKTKERIGQKVKGFVPGGGEKGRVLQRFLLLSLRTFGGLGLDLDFDFDFDSNSC